MLTELDLGTNQLTVLPEEVQELTRLETLVLSNNAIKVSHMTFISIHVTKRLASSPDSTEGHLCAEESSCTGPGGKQVGVPGNRNQLLEGAD